MNSRIRPPGNLSNAVIAVARRLSSGLMTAMDRGSAPVEFGSWPEVDMRRSSSLLECNACALISPRNQWMSHLVHRPGRNFRKAKQCGNQTRPVAHAFISEQD